MSKDPHKIFDITMLYYLVVSLLFIGSASPSNLCSTAGLCCKHRDSECVAQRVYPNHTVDTSQLPCYCDHACLRLDDCCPDYRHFCAVQDCRVSEWGPWSPCSVRCGSGGTSERHRVVLHQASNGGAKCPHLVQAKPCRGIQCDERQPEELWTEGLGSTSSPSHVLRGYDNISHSRSGEDDRESIRQKSWHITEDMPQEEAEHFHTIVPTEHAVLRQPSNSGCMEMVIIRATVGCQHHDSRLHIGTRICVQCPHERDTSRHGGRKHTTSKHSQKTLLGGDGSVDCAMLTQTPIRKFRISPHCHGKLTFLAKEARADCRCSRGLHFELLHTSDTH